MMNAVSLHSTVNQIGQIIGPAAAGGIIELAGIGTPLMVKTVLAMTLRANSVVWAVTPVEAEAQGVFHAYSGKHFPSAGSLRVGQPPTQAARPRRVGQESASHYWGYWANQTLQIPHSAGRT